MQETHFKENDAQGMAIMARFKTHNSTSNGDGNRQKEKWMHKVILIALSD